MVFSLSIFFSSFSAKYFLPLPSPFFSSSAKNIFSFSKYFPSSPQKKTYFPPYLSSFFSSAKYVFSFSKYFSPFPSPFLFSSAKKIYFPSPNISLLFLLGLPSTPLKRYFPSPNINLALFPYPSQFFFSSTKLWRKDPQIGSDMPIALGLVHIDPKEKL